MPQCMASSQVHARGKRKLLNSTLNNVTSSFERTLRSVCTSVSPFENGLSLDASSSRSHWHTQLSADYSAA